MLSTLRKIFFIRYVKIDYNAYILPSMTYYLTVWGNACKANIEIILKLQKWASIFSSFSTRWAMFEKLRWLDVFESMPLHLLFYLTKLYYGMSAEHLRDISVFQTNGSYSLRSRLNYNLSYKKHSNSKTLFETQAFMYGMTTLEYILLKIL